MDSQYDVFLSHNSADKPRVRRLAERLRRPNSITSLELLTTRLPTLVKAASRSCWPTARGFFASSVNWALAKRRAVVLSLRHESA